MKSLHANSKGTDQNALSSTRPCQHICHSFSVKYILLEHSFIQISMFELVTSSHFEILFLEVILKFKSQSYKSQKYLDFFF